MGARKVTNNGTKVRSSCPLARWRHSTGKDNHPSFAVFVSDNDVSMCTCLSAGCGFKGDLAALTVEFIERGGKLEAYWAETVSNNKPDPYQYPDKKIAKLNANMGIYSRPDHSLPGYVEGGIEVGDFIDLIDNIKNREHHAHYVSEMQSMLDDESTLYLRERRCLSVESIARWRLGFHPGARRIAIPQYDRNNKLINIGGRHLPSIFDDPFWDPIPWMHAKGFEKEHYLFGENFLTSFDGKITGVLVEGMFDAIYLDGKGIKNCVAMLGAHLGRYQIMKMLRWFDKLVIVPDGDPAGYKAADQVSAIFNGKIEVIVYPTPLEKDPDNLNDNEIEEVRLLL